MNCRGPFRGTGPALVVSMSMKLERSAPRREASRAPRELECDHMWWMEIPPANSSSAKDAMRLVQGSPGF